MILGFRFFEGMMGIEGDEVGMKPSHGRPYLTYRPIRIPTGPLWCPRGPMGPIFYFSDFWPLGSPGIFRKDSMVIPKEQPLPIINIHKRNMAMWLCV